MELSPEPRVAAAAQTLLRLRRHAIAKPLTLGIRHDSFPYLAARPCAPPRLSACSRLGRRRAGGPAPTVPQHGPESPGRAQDVSVQAGGQAGRRLPGSEEGRGQEVRRKERREIRRRTGRPAGDPAGDLRGLERLRLAAGPRQTLLRAVKAAGSAAEGPQAWSGL